MVIICLCCLAEGNHAKSLESNCDLRSNECHSISAPIKLSELYAQVVQRPISANGFASASSETISNEICDVCVNVLKHFYLFRLKAQKSYEELQEKLNEVNILMQLEQSSGDGEQAKRMMEDLKEGDVSQCLGSDTCADFSNGPFRCRVCQKHFKMRKLLLRHEDTHVSPKRYYCQFCNEEFMEKVICSNHELKAHGYRKSIKQAEKSTENRQLENVILHNRSNSTSLKKVGEKKVFVCDICSKCFTRRSSLNDHKKILHGGLRQYVCHICSRAFGKEDSLKTHLTLHLGKKHCCTICDKSFAKRSFLRNHMEEHESAGCSRKFECTICSKRFIAKSHLTDHELIHSETRPYKCNVCDLCFRQKQQLKIHNYQHVGKPFRCEECSAEFGSQSRLRTHAEKQHKKEDLVTTNEMRAEPYFGDNVVNEELLNEIYNQINCSPITLQCIEGEAENFINSDQIVFLADDGNILLSDIEPFQGL